MKSEHRFPAVAAELAKALKRSVQLQPAAPVPGGPRHDASVRRLWRKNHLNLFGGGYEAQAESLIDRALAQVGY